MWRERREGGLRVRGTELRRCAAAPLRPAIHRTAQQMSGRAGPLLALQLDRDAAQFRAGVRRAIFVRDGRRAALLEAVVRPDGGPGQLRGQRSVSSSLPVVTSGDRSTVRSWTKRDNIRV